MNASRLEGANARMASTTRVSISSAVTLAGVGLSGSIETSTFITVMAEALAASSRRQRDYK
jgi:hypothetical protein